MFASILAIILAVPALDTDAIDALVASGRFRDALPRVRSAIEDPALAAPERRRLRELEARCHFELREYPAAERALRELAAATPGERALPHVLRLARTLALQGVFDEAASLVERARELDAKSPENELAIARTATFVLLRAQRFDDALPHLEVVCAMRPDDALARFSRGIALAKVGRFDDALPDLRAGLEHESSWRDARFEIALVLAKKRRHDEALGPLLDILERDPWDDQACFQTARQLLASGTRSRDRARVRAAAAIMRYFETLRARVGESTRAEHLALTGKPIQAAIERAARWERLGDYARVFRELDALGPDANVLPPVAAFLEGFWKRLGVADGSAAELEKALLAAARDRDSERADTAARLCLARNPKSLRALEYLAARTRTPDLIVPHVHYVARIAAIRKDAESRAALDGARLALRGGGRP